MRKLIFILTMLVLCVIGCLSRSGSFRTNYDFSGIDKIAIVAVEGQVPNYDARFQIADLFIMELLNKGYAPIPLSQVQAKARAVIAEANEISLDTYTELGQLLKAPAILIINVPYLDEEDMSITAQLIDTRDGSVLWMDQATGEIGLPIKESARNQEDYLMDPLLMFNEPQPAPQTVIVPPKPGERTLNSLESQKTKNIISSVCRSLPSAKTKKAEPAAAPVTKTKTRTTRTTSDW
ncbi:MAG: hypothetical protein JW787_16110 [Sedimentisphaerales bacterium]|nr:hypothetical protein [Sedimentisphaerales bacterium]